MMKISPTETFLFGYFEKEQEKVKKIGHELNLGIFIFFVSIVGKSVTFRLSSSSS